MAYEEFAYVYDYLMKDVPYDEWLTFLNEKIKHYSAPGNQVLEIACGTGELSIRLAAAGFKVTGVDLSEDMLTVASKKSFERNSNIAFYQQDMSKLEELGKFDIVTIFCDSLNYLKTPEEVKETFQRVYSHLKDGGLFLFDVHSIFKMVHIFANQTFADNDDVISYIWNCFEGHEPFSIEHDLSFFLFDETSERYDRFDEMHVQRTFPEKDYCEWLVNAGFQILEINADFLHEKPKESSERIFFTCKK
ncbi:class I SAM-dependent methyltransferase [Bacillus sp. FJAT-49736]|uniref:class I SAM-dependent DNA methyltransferase n=1 Tax=Bacillus sp. FJAT-49736 TaxID=2833582 RepID=UPI001BCA3F14|nr:class I SAM-dependent methyltransferase [Bacillus sp. FJAT-49736]MBS4173605.1 class I SAM-dependent methyltransferase [Bacillus sp. FJAT-49736]